MRTTRPSLWRAPLQAIALQQQQAKNALTTNSEDRATLRTEEGGTLEVQPEPFSGGGATGAATSFVYRPGGVSGEVGVFVTPAELKAGLQTIDSSADKVIVVDDTLAPAHLTAADSPWPLNNATFESATPVAILIVDAGATFTQDTIHLRLRDIELEVNGAGTVWLPSVSPGAFLFLETAIVANVGAVPWVEVAGGLSLGVVMNAASRLATGLLAKIESTSAVDVGVFDGSTVAANSFVHGAAPGGTLAFTVDGASQPLVDQAQDNANLAVTFEVLDPQPTFVFRPNGVPGGNVFTDFNALAAAVHLSPGVRDIIIDDSLGAAHMPAGGPYDLDNVVLWGNAAAGETLIIDTGATFTSTSLTVANGCILDSHAAASPWTTTGFFGLYLKDANSTFKSSVAAALLSVTAAGTGGSVTVDSAAILGDGTHPAVTTAAGQLCLVFGVHGGSVVNAHALAGLGTNILAYSASAPGVNLTAQDVTTLTRAYNGITNLVNATGNTGTGSTTVTTTTGNIAKKKSGSVTVGGFAAGSIAGADTITATLVRDIGGGPTVIATQTVARSANQLNFEIGFSYVDTLPDTANHTYSMRLVAGAQNLTVAANQCGIWARED